MGQEAGRDSFREGERAMARVPREEQGTPQTKILRDDEVAQVVRAIVGVLGRDAVEWLGARGILVEDHVRASSLAARCWEAREEPGLTIEEAAGRLKSDSDGPGRRRGDWIHGASSTRSAMTVFSAAATSPRVAADGGQGAHLCRSGTRRY